MDRESSELHDLVGDPHEGASKGVHPRQIERLLNRSWELFAANIGVCAAAGFMLLLVQGMLQGGLSTFVTQLISLLGALEEPVLNEHRLLISLMGHAAVHFASQLMWAWVVLGMSRGALTMVREGTAELDHFFVLDPLLVAKAAVAQLTFAMLVGVGSCAMLVPGVVAYTGLVLWPFALLDEGRGSVGALQRAWQLTDGVRMPMLIAVVVVVALMGLVAFSTCFLGAFVMAPLVHILFALVYEELRQSNLLVLD